MRKYNNTHKDKEAVRGRDGNHRYMHPLNCGFKLNLQNGEQQEVAEPAGNGRQSSLYFNLKCSCITQM